MRGSLSYDLEAIQTQYPQETKATQVVSHDVEGRPNVTFAIAGQCDSRQFTQ